MSEYLEKTLASARQHVLRGLEQLSRYQTEIPHWLPVMQQILAKHGRTPPAAKDLLAALGSSEAEFARQLQAISVQDLKWPLAVLQGYVKKHSQAAEMPGFRPLLKLLEAQYYLLSLGAEPGLRQEMSRAGDNISNDDQVKNHA